MSDATENAAKFLFELFSPYGIEKLGNIQEQNRRFVHYTSAATGLSIIQNEQVWLRSALLMNDFQEVEQGQHCVKSAWNHELLGVRIKAALQRIDVGLWNSVCEMYDETDSRQRLQTYLVSISEHGSGLGAVDEDKFGRLSMWRAYGGDTNVALVVKNTPFISESDALNAYTIPVMYADESRFLSYFEKIVENIEDNISVLKNFDSDLVARMLFNSLLFSSLSTKHPGFSEEMEWRIVHSPTLYPSDRMTFDLEVVDGLPQKVYKLPLKNFPDDGLAGMKVSELLEEVIIGPMANPWPVYEAFCEVMSNAGIQNASEKVKISGIPLKR